MATIQNAQEHPDGIIVRVAIPYRTATQSVFFAEILIDHATLAKLKDDELEERIQDEADLRLEERRQNDERDLKQHKRREKAIAKLLDIVARDG